ncbi:hypothetical protein GF377_02940 [candidate division GN15 bacterium]|nr:hypothetical protein [candidate division GN15 bacterium]
MSRPDISAQAPIQTITGGRGSRWLMLCRMLFIVMLGVIAGLALSCADTTESTAPTSATVGDPGSGDGSPPVVLEERRTDEPAKDVPYPREIFLRVVSTYPSQGVFDEISVLDSIEVVFSKPIVCSTVTLESFSTGPGVTGTFVCDGSTVTFHSDRAFEFAVFYEVTLSRDIRATDGSTLPAPYRFYVFTEVEPG